MAKVRIKINTKKLEANLSKIRKNLNAALEKEMPDIVKDSILAGVSPVKGHKFADYSDSYKTAIKKGRVKGKSNTSPINLKVSGKMTDSIKAKVDSRGLVVYFDDYKPKGSKDKLSDIHNKGLGRNVRRALLPTETGEIFNRSITLRLRELAREVILKILG